LRLLPVATAADAPSEERLIPFVDAFVDRVDLAGKCIWVDWGLDF
jgi:16S rRNA processing protein RimM